jgi:hypothetical protein
VQAQSSDGSLDGVDLGATTQRTHRTPKLKRIQSGEGVGLVLPRLKQISLSAEGLHLALGHIDWPAVHVPAGVRRLRAALAIDHESIWELSGH